MENRVNGIVEGLNEEQRKAVCCTEGPVLIVAGAGSGKTRVLTSRLAYMLAGGVAPESVLVLTFTKKAASEMKERIATMVGPRTARKVVMGTFHSVFVRFLREYATSLGYPEQFTIYDTGDSQSAMKTCIKELGLDDKVYKPREVLSRISSAKNSLITVEGYRRNNQLLIADSHAKKPRIIDLYELYQRKLKQNGVMDFDDILLNMNYLLRDNKEALMSIADRFSHIMVDEYQDTNYAQYLILKKLAQFHHNICVVGDDSQSIYAFRGAKIENILNFKRDYPESKTFRLEKNYRSTSVIVDAANTLIEHNTGRIPKTCQAVGEEGERIKILKAFTEGEESTMIVSEILSRMRADGAQYQDFAILYRTNAQSRALEEQLRRRNIPYMIYSGNSFFDRAEVKDMMAYFKLVVNPSDDESFRRIVNKPARAIGDTTLNALGNAALAAGKTLLRAAYLDNLEQFGLKPAAVAKLRAFCDMISSLNRMVSRTDAFELARKIADDSGLYAFYKADTSIEGMTRSANVEELVSSVQNFVEERLEDNFGDGEDAPVEGYTVTLDDFLENVSLLSNVDV
ncbi:MAG: UvrD-helicase domain-containing protein, partial [Bacteroidales bacterium]|nr:UvrD-helicase domain-containing protein [Candidatus Cryptobacteroides equifaecalis]